MEAERLYAKQPSRTIQQKRGGEGALEMVDNRPAGILQTMSEHPIQRVKTDLRVQNGPSCWLTVLESIASYFPQVQLTTLRNILTMYASSTEVRKTMDEDTDKGYIKALRVTKAQIDKAITKIDESKNKGEKFGINYIAQSRLYKLLSKISNSVARIADDLHYEKYGIKYSTIINVLSNASNMLKQILEKFNGKKWVEQIAIIAGNVQTEFSGDNEYSTFVVTIENCFNLPLWVGINNGIRDNDLPFEDTDFRKSTPRIEKYNHAIQIVDYSKNVNDDWIKYKDPNRGNYEYIVSWEQFKQFANENSLYLFSYKSVSQIPQIIKN